MKEPTSYGHKKQGTSRFVIVAPHAAGDDLNSREISDELADILNASVVVNTNFVKPTNRTNQRRPVSERKPIADFNKLSFSNGQYRWDNRPAEMKEFYDDVMQYVVQAQRPGGVLVAYVHSLADNQRAVDIGVGLKEHNGRLKGTRGTRDRHPKAGTNTGVRRASRDGTARVQRAIQDKLNQDNLAYIATIGEVKPAWSRQNGVQFHAGQEGVASMQLEIGKGLRNTKSESYIANVMADGLKAYFRG